MRGLPLLSSSARAGLVFAAACLVVLPQVGSQFWLSVFTSTACFTLAAASVAFMYARLGMVSLAQVSLMGVGGWIALRLNYALPLAFELNMIIAALGTTLFGLLLSLPALRLRGLYLAVVTLMAAGGLEIIFATNRFPNGGSGFWGVQTGAGLPMRRPVYAETPEAFLCFVIVCTVVGFLIIGLHQRGKPGRAWALIRRSEAAAVAAGVDVTRYKIWAFGLAGLLSGAAGALLAGSLGFLDPGNFRAPESIMLFTLAVVGGAGHWLGVIIAAVLYKILPALLSTWGVNADLSYVIFGAGLLNSVVTAPDGVAAQVIAGLETLKSKLRVREKVHA
jgi:branched-chain amino acid transport system permease protein